MVHQTAINKFQYIQNSAARVLTFSKKSSHITPFLHRLHWLPFYYCIQYKILLITYKARHGLAPLYISDLIHTYSPVHTLRSSDTGLLLIPWCHKLASFGGISVLCAPPPPHSGILFPNRFVISLHYNISKPTLKHIFSFLVSLISDCICFVFLPAVMFICFDSVKRPWVCTKAL